MLELVMQLCEEWLIPLAHSCLVFVKVVTWEQVGLVLVSQSQ